MNRLYIILLTLPLLLTACSDNTDEPVTGWSVMSVQVGIQPTRNVTPYMDTVFVDNEQLGVRVIDSDGSTTNYNFQNVCYTSSTEDGAQVWTVEAGTEVLINENYAKVMAYYPYDSGVDAAAIDIDCSTETDWMYCTWRPQFNYSNPIVALYMKHAQSVIKAIIKSGDSPDDYTGNPTLKTLTVEGDCLARKGTLDATTGTLSDLSENSYTITYSGSEQLGTFAAQQDYVLTTGTSGTITFTLEIGEAKYKATTAAITLQQGYIYQYVLYISDTKLIIDPVRVMPWTDVTTPYTVDGVVMDS